MSDRDASACKAPNAALSASGRRRVPAIVGAVLSALAVVVATAVPALAHDNSPPASPTSGITLDPGLGALRHPVSTRSTMAQAYFDQGLKLAFAFNHEAAIRSFQRAFELDPKLAMAQWGIALALGPNINKPMDPPAHKAAYAAVQKAIALEQHASPDELARQRESPRALYGLHAVLVAEGRAKEAAAVERRFRHAWREADAGLDLAAL